VDDEPPKILFPSEYPISVIGFRRDEFHPTVVRIVREHAPGFDEASITVQDSRDGSYCSLRLRITATGEAQLRALHAALMAEPVVKLVL
jgi:putative lipoic acid-binding regulatory protein